MASNVRLNDITIDGGEVDAELKRWREAIEGAHTWSVGGHANFDGDGAGYALYVKGVVAVKVAKCGGTAISAMSGVTPGSGNVTLYDFNGTTLNSTGIVVAAKNMHPTGTVTANAWLKICYIDGYPFVFWEPCS